jgi:hypothetical protein
VIKPTFTGSSQVNPAAAAGGSVGSGALVGSTTGAVVGSGACVGSVVAAGPHAASNIEPNRMMITKPRIFSILKLLLIHFLWVYLKASRYFEPVMYASLNNFTS